MTTATRQYVRLRFQTLEGPRSVWAIKGSEGAYWVVDREGQQPEPRELVIVKRADIILERLASMNLHYGELET